MENCYLDKIYDIKLSIEEYILWYFIYIILG